MMQAIRIIDEIKSTSKVPFQHKDGDAKAGSYVYVARWARHPTRTSSPYYLLLFHIYT